MTNHDFETPADDDDLPMTVRKARQERAAQLGATAAQRPQLQAPASTYPGETAVIPPSDGYANRNGHSEDYDDRVTVTRFDVPFFRLMVFFLKAVLAAIPALLLLGSLLYGLGVILRVYFPWIVQTEILIRFPN